MTVLPTRTAELMQSHFFWPLGGPDRTPVLDAAELLLAATPQSAAMARAFTTTVLRKWNLEALTDSCSLVMSELVTNSVTETRQLITATELRTAWAHTEPMIIARLALTATALFAEVWDGSSDKPQAADPDESAENGRGLILVGAFTDEWGSYPSLVGKVVFGRWALPPASAQVSG